MAQTTQILQSVKSSDPAAGELLLVSVYDELRKLAAAKLAHEAPGQTLQPAMAARKGPARRQNREEFWRRIVTRQPASGLSVRAWCSRHEVTEASFYAWRRTLARRGILRSASAKKRRARVVAVEVAHGPNC